MVLNEQKTKIVCTIGPASSSQEVMEQMIRAGMDVARLNFSHGSFDDHKGIIDSLRKAQKAVDKRIAIMGDLPGPKIRIGEFTQESIVLMPEDPFILTTQDVPGTKGKVSVNFARLPEVVHPGNILYLNDGFIKMEVVAVEGPDVHCKVAVGGELSSRKGLNLPGIDLGISAFTDQDKECLKFAHDQGLDAVSQSFVETAQDIDNVRKASEEMGYTPFIIAKIERALALDNIDGILDAADGIMIARGDLGVEVPIEKMAIIQKRLMEKIVFFGKPVITATQMLESMTTHSLPTRAEATDVANAIFDGTDCVMLSGESAVGKYPVLSVKMLARIAAETEPSRPRYRMEEALKAFGRDGDITYKDMITLSVETCISRTAPATILVPTLSGSTARSIARFRPDEWITAVSPHESTCQGLQFSYGVYPLYEPKYPEDWKVYIRDILSKLKIKGNFVVLVEGPSLVHPEDNHRMELIDLQPPPAAV